MKIIQMEIRKKIVLVWQYDSIPNLIQIIILLKKLYCKKMFGV